MNPDNHPGHKNDDVDLAIANLTIEFRNASTRGDLASARAVARGLGPLVASRVLTIPADLWVVQMVAPGVASVEEALTYLQQTTTMDRNSALSLLWVTLTEALASALGGR